MLRTAFGPAIARFLEDPAVIEVMLNPDGRLWIDRLSSGLADTGEVVSAPDGERIVRLVAHHVGAEVHASNPRVSAELPETGERFEGLLPPVVTAPAFAIRKPAVAVFTLDDYVAKGIMTPGQAGALKEAVAARHNILVAGGTSSGKTTLTNALLAEVAKTSDRVVLIEDTRELQCTTLRLSHSSRDTTSCCILASVRRAHRTCEDSPIRRCLEIIPRRSILGNSALGSDYIGLQRYPLPMTKGPE
jgi:type IV secretion system protein VirB11